MAKSNPSMPNEILDKILSLSSSTELLQARLVSHELCAISSFYLFKYQCFDMNANAAVVESFRNVLAREKVVDNVQEVEIIGPLVCQPQFHQFRFRDANASQQPWEFGKFGYQLSEMPENIKGALRHLDRLRHLSALTVRFEEDYHESLLPRKEKRDIYRNDLLASVLAPLISSRSIQTRIQHLCISNLQNRNTPSMTESVGFIDLLRNLRTLKLTIKCTVDPYTRPSWSSHERIFLEESVRFFQTLPDTWLRPAESLQSLHLSAELPWGWYPKVDFRHIRFPRLRSLALAGFTFSHDWHLEWLLSHAGSLRCLRLVSCTMLLFADTTPQCLDSDGYLDPDSNTTVRTHRRFDGRLSHYLRAFANALPHLQLFSLRSVDRVHWEDEDGDVATDRTEATYCLLFCFGYKTYTEKRYDYYFTRAFDYPDDNEALKRWREREQLQRGEDKEALLELFDIIEERNRANPSQVGRKLPLLRTFNK